METIQDNRSIQMRSTSQLSQRCALNNNEVLAKNNKPLSVFGFQMVASREFIAMWTKGMSVAFPNKPAEFWGLVAQTAQQEGLSERRLEYIYRELCGGRKLYDISDIFTIDKTLKKWSDGLQNLQPYKPFARVGGRYYMTIEEAEEMGAKYEIWEMDIYGNMRIKPE